MHVLISFDKRLDETYRPFLMNGEMVPVRVIQGTPRRRRLAIRVTRRGEIELIVPVRTTEKDMQRALNSKTGWIAKHLYQIRQLPAVSPKHYTRGEKHLFRGRWYSLEILPVTGKKNGAVIIEQETGSMKVLVQDPSPERVRTVLEHWYRKEAHVFVSERMSALCPQLPWLDGIPSWRVRTMRRRWGSCSSDGLLTLNTHLIKASSYCLDFVILHELTHLREMNHGPKFYAILESLLPDWRERKRELEWVGEILLSSD